MLGFRQSCMCFPVSLPQVTKALMPSAAGAVARASLSSHSQRALHACSTLRAMLLPYSSRQAVRYTGPLNPYMCPSVAFSVGNPIPLSALCIKARAAEGDGTPDWPCAAAGIKEN